MRTALPFLLLLPLAGACGRDSETTPAATASSKPASTAQAPAAPAAPAKAGEPAPASSAGALEALRANEAAIAARPELTLERVRLAHILVTFTGAPRSTVKDRTPEQAEARAAELFARVQKGEDFETLMRSSSDDSGGGTYTLVTGQPEQGAFLRKQMVPAFGDVGWRLAVGEIGVAPHDAQQSPFGWHIIKRLE